MSSWFIDKSIDADSQCNIYKFYRARQQEKQGLQGLFLLIALAGTTSKAKKQAAEAACTMPLERRGICTAL
ncbi:hypothetical protein [Desulfobacula phenolica]|uniref:hypothetical protein n=1 Tax=Desulfobacula phenolica TaxID=90732 RepID=UPI0011145EFA|nr:hypothetical protein [Desulfobacula phenolica]